MIKTGVKATEEERKELLELAQQARTTPVMAFDALGKTCFAKQAHETAQQACHRIALAHGLPEIPGFYGITGAGEFVRV